MNDTIDSAINRSHFRSDLSRKEIIEALESQVWMIPVNFEMIPVDIFEAVGQNHQFGYSQFKY